MTKKQTRPRNCSRLSPRLRTLERLESRALLAGVTAQDIFNQIIITGTNQADQITLRLKPGAPNTLEIWDSGVKLPQDFTRSGNKMVFIRGMAGDDVLWADEVNGSFANDGSGAWLLDFQPQSGNDTVIGGSGDDHILAGQDQDSIDGRGGRDMLTVGLFQDITASGNITLSNTQSVSTINATTHVVNFTSIESAQLLGNNGANILDASASSLEVTLAGGQGNDTLRAGSGRATLQGGPGNDLLLGGAGEDTLWGEAGDDQYDGGGAYDTIVVMLGDESGLAGSGDLALNDTTVTISTSTTEIVETFIGVEQVNLIGNDADNKIEAANFAGFVLLNGGSGSDTLRADLRGRFYLDGGMGPGTDSAFVAATAEADQVAVFFSSIQWNGIGGPQWQFNNLDQLVIDGGDGVDYVSLSQPFVTTQVQFLNFEPKSIDLGNAVFVDEQAEFVRIGSFIDLAGTAWTGTVHYGDGGPDDWEPLLLNDDRTFLLNHAYADDGAYQVRVRIANNTGGVFKEEQLVVTVHNVRPELTLAGEEAVDEGAEYELTLGTVIDPGIDTVTGYRVTWGDGSVDDYSASQIEADPVVKHTYTDGTLTRVISVSVFDEDGEHLGAGGRIVLVENVAPTLTISGASTVAEGSTFTLTLDNVVDPGDDEVSRYVIHWGDGQSTILASAEIPTSREVTHIYADGTATHTIRVDLQDEDSFVSGSLAPDEAFGVGGATLTTYVGAGDSTAVAIAASPSGDGTFVTIVDSGNGRSLVRYLSDGTVDTAFGDGGRVVVTHPEFSPGSSVALDVVGRIYVSGSHLNQEFAVVRYNANGSIDTAFGNDGMATVDFNGDDSSEFASGVTLGPDDSIFLFGDLRDGEIGAIARLTFDGELVASFGTGGKLLLDDVLGTSFGYTLTLAITPDDQILAIANASFLGPTFFRFDANGIVDTAFGLVPVDFSSPASLHLVSMGFDAAGNILIPAIYFSEDTWTDFALVRFTADGALDASFGNELGYMSFPMTLNGTDDVHETTYALAMTPSGGLLIAGSVYDGESSNIGILRLTGELVPDSSFNTDGFVVTALPAFGFEAAYSVASSPTVDGDIYVIAELSDGPNFVRYDADGPLDTTFGEGTGRVVIESPFANGFTYDSLLVDGLGNLLLFGSHENATAVARYTSAGALDTSFGVGGLLTIDLGSSSARIDDVLFDSEGRLVVVGTTFEPGPTLADVVVGRLSADFTLDTTFGDQGLSIHDFGGTEFGVALAIALDNSIYVQISSDAGLGVAHFSEFGILDSNFGDGGFFPLESPEGHYLHTGLATDDDGRLYVPAASSETGFGFGLARYDAWGHLDTAFGNGGVYLVPIGLDENAFDVARDAAGRLLVTGQAYNPINGSYDIALARLMTEVIETSYEGLAELPLVVTNVAPLPAEEVATTTENAVVFVDIVASAEDPGMDAIQLVDESAGIVSARLGEDVILVLETASVGQFGNFVTFDPGSDFHFLAEGEVATVVVKYILTDGEDESLGMLTITVLGENDGLIIGANNPIYTETEVQVAVTTQAPHGELSYTVTNVSRSGGGAVHAASGYSIDSQGVFHWTPGAGQLGEYVFEVTVTDDARVATLQFTVMTLGVVDGVLTILTTGGDDKIQIKPTQGDADRFSVSINENDLHFRLHPANNSDQPYLGVERVLIHAFSGDDDIQISGQLAIASELHGGSGNDKLQAGDGHDVIFGDSGDDQLWGSDGDDFLIGGSGFDKLHGQGGNDILVGGSFANAFSYLDFRLISDAWSLGNSDLDLADDNSDGDFWDEYSGEKLNGGAGSDWFLVFAGDQTDFKNNDSDKLTRI